MQNADNMQRRSPWCGPKRRANEGGHSRVATLAGCGSGLRQQQPEQLDVDKGFIFIIQETNGLLMRF